MLLLSIEMLASALISINLGLGTTHGIELYK